MYSTDFLNTPPLRVLAVFEAWPDSHRRAVEHLMSDGLTAIYLALESSRCVIAAPRTASRRRQSPEPPEQSAERR
ncbi:hypothetical protein XA68_16282 [Ophiocordyceps unilateralis]|uniref:Uncharacterized protein n=1 Tax=Ophiocordyceps unilateralis TaxID=268505 RepID=A0A2A9P6U0_OPHUN|nr:hypothetical protein XA68_16282 [Ophiocordyceps unilateralis]